MKVLHVSSASSWRGGEQQIAYLAEELARHGVEQLVFSPGGSATERYFRSRGVPHRSYRKRTGFDPFGAFEVHRTCKKDRIQLVHAHDSHAHSLLVISAALFGNSVPAVVSRRVDFPVGRGIVSRWKYSHSSVRAYLCVSDFVREVMRPFVTEADRLHVVHDGVDLEGSRPAIEPILRAEHGLPKDRILIGNIAAIAPEKDYRTFVEAAERLLHDGLDATFFVVGGDGGEERMVRELAAAKGLADRIVLMGFREDARSILSQLDLLLFTSKTEGLGTTVLDAFAAGIPVVATRAGGLPEVVKDRETGLTAPVGDSIGLVRAVREVLSDDGLRSRLVAEAMRFVRGFSKGRTAERTLDIYRSVLNGLPPAEGMT